MGGRTGRSRSRAVEELHVEHLVQRFGETFFDESCQKLRRAESDPVRMFVDSRQLDQALHLGKSAESGQGEILGDTESQLPETPVEFEGDVVSVAGNCRRLRKERKPRQTLPLRSDAHSLSRMELRHPHRRGRGQYSSRNRGVSARNSDIRNVPCNHHSACEEEPPHRSVYYFFRGTQLRIPIYPRAESRSGRFRHNNMRRCCERSVRNRRTCKR